MSKIMKSPFVNIQRDFYSMQTTENGENADVVMYGEIVEEQPVDWWTGKPIEGNYIMRTEFLKDLEKLSNSKEITIRMDSVGGDASVSFFIHNKLREMAQNGTKLNCVVDGVAMSGGSLIMCACDNVKVNPSSLIMIHKCWSVLWGGYNADDLRSMAESNDAYDKAQASIYMRKTGLSEQKILNMMGDTTYMTGKEAVELGFADELTEDAGLKISASANGTSLFVKGHEVHMIPGMFAPDYIPTISSDDKSVEVNKEQAVVTVENEGGKPMTKEELREQYPDLVAELEAEAKAVSASDEAIKTAIDAERTRMQEIDSIACLYNDELVNEAKYGETACSAQELAYRAAKESAKNGNAFINAMKADATASNTQDVKPSAPEASESEHEKTPEEIKAEKKAQIKSLLGKN